MIMGTQTWSIAWCSCVFGGPGVLTEVERDTVITMIRYGIGEVVKSARVGDNDDCMGFPRRWSGVVCTLFICEEDG